MDQCVIDSTASLTLCCQTLWGLLGVGEEGGATGELLLVLFPYVQLETDLS